MTEDYLTLKEIRKTYKITKKLFEELLRQCTIVKGYREKQSYYLIMKETQKCKLYLKVHFVEVINRWKISYLYNAVEVDALIRYKEDVLAPPKPLPPQPKKINPFEELRKKRAMEAKQ